MQFLIVSGMSGAGKSKALDCLEDLGFYCVDNMPEDLIPQFAQLCMATKSKFEKVALVTDIRSGLTFDGLFMALDSLEKMECEYSIVFVECSKETLVKRYKETRRKHPLTKDGKELLAAVEREQKLLEPIRNRANYIIDTTNLSTGKLRGELVNLFAGEQRDHAMTVNVISFGFKYGLPMDADLVFDVRMLPNPYYIAELKHRTGLEKPVRDFVFSYQQTLDFMEKLEDMMSFSLPLYVEEGKTNLVIAVGCTGGHHRSVAVAKELGDHIARLGFVTTVGHRDISRE